MALPLPSSPAHHRFHARAARRLPFLHPGALNHAGPADTTRARNGALIRGYFYATATHYLTLLRRPQYRGLTRARSLRLRFPPLCLFALLLWSGSPFPRRPVCASSPLALSVAPREPPTGVPFLGLCWFFRMCLNDRTPLRAPPRCTLSTRSEHAHGRSRVQLSVLLIASVQLLFVHFSPPYGVRLPRPGPLHSENGYAFSTFCCLPHAYFCTFLRALALVPSNRPTILHRVSLLPRAVFLSAAAALITSIPLTLVCVCPAHTAGRVIVLFGSLRPLRVRLHSHCRWRCTGRGSTFALLSPAYAGPAAATRLLQLVPPPFADARLMLCLVPGVHSLVSTPLSVAQLYCSPSQLTVGCAHSRVLVACGVARAPFPFEIYSYPPSRPLF